MASPHPRLSFDSADRRLLVCWATTTAAFGIVLGTLACTSLPPMEGIESQPPRARWMQLLGSPKASRHRRVPTTSSVVHGPVIDRALASLSWDEAASQRTAERWLPPTPRVLCFSYPAPTPDPARDVFGPARMPREVPARIATTRSEARVRLGRPTLHVLVSTDPRD